MKPAGFTTERCLGSGSAALVILAAFWLLGGWILGIFNPAYDTPTMHAVLVIFGIGATIASFCGPTDLLMQLTGLQHYLMKLLVIVNVVGNALKYAAEGKKIDLTLFQNGADATLKVRDYGPGIAPELLPQWGWLAQDQ